jgi:hypothetical protein
MLLLPRGISLIGWELLINTDCFLLTPPLNKEVLLSDERLLSYFVSFPIPIRLVASLGLPKEVLCPVLV